MRILNLVAFGLSLVLVFGYFYSDSKSITYSPVISETTDSPSEIVQPKQKTQVKKTRDYSQVKLAKAISSLYKHVSYEEALHVVQVSHKYAKTNSVRPILILGIIASESSFKSKAISSHGAIGYTQIMPKYHQDKIQGRNIYDTHVNIEVGTKILGDCFKKYKDQFRALGCYNGSTTEEQINKYVTKVKYNKQKILSLSSI